MASVEKAPLPKSSIQKRVVETDSRSMPGAQPAGESLSWPAIQGESVLLTPDSVKKLQRTVGNQATTQLLARRNLIKAGTHQARMVVSLTSNQVNNQFGELVTPARGLQSDVPVLQAAPLAQISAGGTPRIQRWINQGLGGFYSQKGHEAITELSTQAWKNDLDNQIKGLEKEKKGQKGEERKSTQEKIDALKDELAMLANVRKGARFNDFVHATSDMEMVKQSKWQEGKKEEEQTLSAHMAEGRLIFIHAMARKVTEEAWRTQHKVMMWAEFTYRVAIGDILPSTHLGDLEINVEKDFNHGPTLAALLDIWSDKTVGWLFTGSENSTQHSSAQGIALGSLLHMLQDSFCMAHAQREVARRAEANARLIKSFNFYQEQSHNPVFGMHRKADVLWGYDWLHSTEERVHKTAGAWEAEAAGAKVIKYFRDHKPWEEAKGLLLGIFGLSPELEKQKPQDREWGKEDSTANGNRLTSASGRLFRGQSILSQFKSAFDTFLITAIDRFGWFEPKQIRSVRKYLIAYNRLLEKEKKSFTVPFKPSVRVEKFIYPEGEAILDAIYGVRAALEYYRDDNNATKNKGDLISALESIEHKLDEDYNEVRLDVESMTSMEGSLHKA